MWTGQQALERGLIDQLGNLQAATAYAAKLAKLGKDYPVRYQEAPLGAFERMVINLNQNVSVHVLRAWGLRLPGWVAQVPGLVPQLQWLRTARAGTPNIYADCLCRPR